jgi:hypothetical protein
MWSIRIGCEAKGTVQRTVRETVEEDGEVRVRGAEGVKGATWGWWEFWNEGMINRD